MELLRPGAGDGDGGVVSCTPRGDSRGITGLDRWRRFLQLYESFIIRELALEHPQFTRALRQLERDTHLEQERQSVQVLATLRLKDARISELQKLMSEQREQLDVVLDELERRETKEDKEVQATEERQAEDTAIQTEAVDKETKQIETQTEKDEEERGVLPLLEKLEKELKTLENKNLALEKELQQRTTNSEANTEDSDEMKNCLEILQRGVDAMNLSCGCVENPLLFCIGVPNESGVDGGRKEFKTMTTCVNIEHRLEAQTVRLEHVHECLYLWRDAVVQHLKRQYTSDHGIDPIIQSLSLPLVTCREKIEDTGVVTCSRALRDALGQIRQHLYRYRGRYFNDNQVVLKEMAKILAKGKSGVKVAAKLVQKWAGWEVKHLNEVRCLRQGFAEERGMELGRRTALLKRIDQLEEQGINLQAEVNALRKNSRTQDGKTVRTLPSPFRKPGKMPHGADKLEYPQLVLRLATLNQTLLAKDDQLAAANETIRALSSCATPSLELINSTMDTAMDSMNRLAVELQRVSKQKLDFFQKRENNLISVGKYFQLEKSCLQLQSRLEFEQKQVAMMKAASQVNEQERDELSMKVERLETEALLVNLSRKSVISSLSLNRQAGSTVERSSNDSSPALFLMLKRLRLIENNNKELRERLRNCQQQLALMKQRPDYKGDNSGESSRLETNALECVAEHHQKCVSEFNKFITQQSSAETSQIEDNETARRLEWEVFLSHYEDLWIAFHFLYSYFNALPQITESSSLNVENFRRRDGSVSDETNWYSNQQLSLEALEFELSKRDEKILLLQQRIITQEGTELCTEQPDTSSSISSEQIGCNHAVGLTSTYSIENVVQNVKKQVAKTEAGDPILAPTKPQEPPFKLDSMSSNELDNETTLVKACGNTKAMQDPQEIASELEECLATCGYLVSQNTKLTRRLRAEKEANKEYLKEQEELRTQLHARTETNSELQHTLKEFQGQVNSSSKCPEDALRLEEKYDADVEIGTKNVSSQCHENGEESEALREQLASREQENLTLVQSLCSIKEKYAKLEAFYQKELRVKAAEHAERMENYMATVNETLSRIEKDKHRLDEENVKLRSSLQQFEEKNTRNKLEESQRSTKGTNTEPDTQLFDVAAYTQEKESLVARVQDLELQLLRERKLVQVVEQKQLLENQQEEQHESNVTAEALKVRQEYEKRCEVFREWRNKFQQEFAAYQQVQHAFEHESDRRVEFLSVCIKEFIRVADATSPVIGKRVSIKELYEAVMALARAPPNEQLGTTSDGDSRRDLLLHVNKGRNDSEINEAIWWKLRASKMETYVRSVMLQNDTFEDTIRQLELSMNNVKDELASRLSREAQLVSKLSTLKTEMTSAKEHAAIIAEKYQVAATELEKRQEEATSRGDENQRARLAVQRKTELLSQQKTKISFLEHELQQAAKKLERLAAAEKQAALLQQKAKEHTQQLLQARQSYERCQDDNVQLANHLEKIKERDADVVARLKAARAENAHLRAQFTAFKHSVKTESADISDDRFSHQREANAASIASYMEQLRALKRRVLQKQDVIVSYKAKVVACDAQLERQRETLVKLARANRELQQGQRQQQEQEHDYLSTIHSTLEDRLNLKQTQLDGLRASVYDSFEAFVFSRAVDASKPPVSLGNPWTEEVSDSDNMFEIKRWTDFSMHDLEELKLARGSQPLGRPRESESRGKNDHIQRKKARAALRDVEGALEANPEDCRAEICELLHCLCN